MVRFLLPFLFRPMVEKIPIFTHKRFKYGLNDIYIFFLNTFEMHLNLVRVVRIVRGIRLRAVLKCTTKSLLKCTSENLELCGHIILQGELFDV